MVRLAGVHRCQHQQRQRFYETSVVPDWVQKLRPCATAKMCRNFSRYIGRSRCCTRHALGNNLLSGF
jgi:myo-inositol catabolism protein IolC